MQIDFFSTNIKNRILFIPIFLFTSYCTAQTTVQNNDFSLSPDSVSRDSLYKQFDEAPKFPGGDQALYRFLSTRLRYPEQAVRQNINGKVLVKFMVCEDGTLCNEEIVSSLEASCDREVLRVIKAMPKWEPAKLDGKPVKTMFTLPVHFRTVN